MGQWTYYTIGAVVYKSLLLHFMHLWEQNEAFPLLYPIKLGETNIWRNWTRNGPSVVIPFWKFSVVLLGDFEWGVYGGGGEDYSRPLQPSSTQSNATSISFVNRLSCNIYYYFFNWRIIALQCCVGFCYTTTWISCMVVHIFPPSWPPFHPYPTPYVITEHQA